MKIQMIQHSPCLGDIKKNFAFHENSINEAKKDNIDLLVFPELSLTGYDLKDLTYSCSLNQNNILVDKFKELSEDISFVIGAPWEEPKGIFYNSALVFDKGELIHIHKKAQLPNFGMFKEAMIFKAGSRFLTFELKGVKCGILICREILFPVYSYLYHLQGVELLIAVSNSPFRGLNKGGFSSFALWERAGEINSINHQMNYIFVNRSGYENGMGFGGGSFFAQAGKGIVNKLSYLKEDKATFDLDFKKMKEARVGGNYLRDENGKVVLSELKRILEC